MRGVRKGVGLIERAGVSGRRVEGSLGGRGHRGEWGLSGWDLREKNGDCLLKRLWDSGCGSCPRAMLLGCLALCPTQRPLPPVGTSILEDPRAGKTSTLAMQLFLGAPFGLSPPPLLLASAACQSCGAVGVAVLLVLWLPAWSQAGRRASHPPPWLGTAPAASDQPSAAWPVPPRSSSSRWRLFTSTHTLTLKSPARLSQAALNPLIPSCLLAVVSVPVAVAAITHS